MFQKWFQYREFETFFSWSSIFFWLSVNALQNQNVLKYINIYWVEHEIETNVASQL